MLQIRWNETPPVASAEFWWHRWYCTQPKPAFFILCTVFLILADHIHIQFILSPSYFDVSFFIKLMSICQNISGMYCICRDVHRPMTTSLRIASYFLIAFLSFNWSLFWLWLVYFIYKMLPDNPFPFYISNSLNLDILSLS